MQQSKMKYFRWNNDNLDRKHRFLWLHSFDKHNVYKHIEAQETPGNLA